MDFTNKIENIIKQSCISYALLAAKEAGIFDTLKKADHPLTSLQVADSKQLKERYVREVLGSLVSASLVLISSNDQGEPTYYLHEKAKEEIDNGFLSKLAQVTVLMNQYRPVMECFPLSGPQGKVYGDAVFNYFDEMNTGCRTDVRINRILENVPGLREKLEQGISAIEFGCGSALLLRKFAKMFPKSEFTVSDMDATVISKIEEEFSNIPNMHFEVVDICQSIDSQSKKYDWALTIQVMHDLPHPLVAMKNVRNILKKDNRSFYTMYDMSGHSTHAASVDNDVQAFFYAFSTFLCIPESYQVKDSEAYGCCWGKDTAVSLLRKAGFAVDVHDVEEGVAVYHCT